MAVDDDDDTFDSPPDPPIEMTGHASASYPVARSAVGNDVLNTIDIIGERDFSV
jgi:hypothetical protein